MNLFEFLEMFEALDDLPSNKYAEKGEVKSATFNREKGITTVVLKDRRKGMAKVAQDAAYDEKVGFALAYCYSIFASKTKFNKIVEKEHNKK